MVFTGTEMIGICTSMNIFEVYTCLDLFRAILSLFFYIYKTYIYYFIYYFGGKEGFLPRA